VLNFDQLDNAKTVLIAAQPAANPDHGRMMPASLPALGCPARALTQGLGLLQRLRQ
jgi:hypothetical protein